MDSSAETRTERGSALARIARCVRVRPRTVVVGACIAVVASTWLVAATLTYHPPTEGIESWESLEDAIGAAIREADDIKQSMSFEGLSRVPAFVEISRPEYEQPWQEMIRRGDLPLVALAGYRCIEAHDGSNAFGAALIALLSRSKEASLVLVAPMMERVGAGENVEKDFDAFTRFLCSASWEQRPNLAVTIGFVPNDFLYQWFHRPRNGVVPTFAEAYALGKLFENANDDRPITDEMKLRLNAYAAIPGVARLVFVSHADRSHEGFSIALARVIEDVSLSDAVVAMSVSVHRDYVREHPFILEGELSEARRELINKALERE